MDIGGPQIIVRISYYVLETHLVWQAIRPNRQVYAQLDIKTFYMVIVKSITQNQANLLVKNVLQRLETSL